MKKIILSLLMITLLIGACSKEIKQEFNQTENKEFIELMDSILIETFDPEDIGINFTFVDPSKYGIEPKPYRLGFVDQDESKESYNLIKDQIKALNLFSINDLTQDQDLDRRILVDALEKSLSLESFYDFNTGNSVLGYQRAFAGSLPAYLETFVFHNAEDVLSYLNFLEYLPEDYGRYVDFEIERQERGTGYGKDEIDKIIVQAQETVTAASADDYFLNEKFLGKIKVLNLSDQEALFIKHKELMKTNMVEAYQVIVDKLSNVNAPDSVGLAQKPNGKEYYEALLKVNSGSSRSIKDVKSFIDRKKADTQNGIQYLLKGQDFEKMFDAFQNNSYSDFNSDQELMDFLETETPKYFPEIASVNYNINLVDPSMASASSPAFYFTPQVDYQKDLKQSIFVNGDFDNINYPTYAHEGFPGHMYQFNYFLEKGFHPVRQLYTSNGNAEGWANYIESIAHFFINDDKTFVEFANMYNQLVQILHLEMDLGINYDGWSMDQFSEYVGENFGIEDTTVIKDIYVDFAHNPAVYPTYYLSSLYIQDLRDQYEMALGKKYDIKEFHKSFLDFGSASFDIIEPEFKKMIKALN